EDTAWQPVWKDEFESKPLLRKAIIFGYGPFRCWMSIAHWLVCHFNLKTFRPNEIKRVKISLACVFAFMAIGWPLIIYKTGIMGWIKFWLMPWLGHTLREGNACADCLAKMGASSDSALVILDMPPVELSLALHADAQGVVFVRD
ncbi:omega-6 fatty acid desaturase chloroplastic-like, partial [Trifolium pratense]